MAVPDSLRYAGYIHSYAEASADGALTEMALDRIERSKPDFVFLYMVETDQKNGLTGTTAATDPRTWRFLSSSWETASNLERS